MSRPPWSGTTAALQHCSATPCRENLISMPWPLFYLHNFVLFVINERNNYPNLYIIFVSVCGIRAFIMADIAENVTREESDLCQNSVCCNQEISHINSYHCNIRGHLARFLKSKVCSHDIETFIQSFSTKTQYPAPRYNTKHIRFVSENVDEFWLTFIQGDAREIRIPVPYGVVAGIS